jgi:hypothetical protein
VDFVRTKETLEGCLYDDRVLLERGQLEQALPQDIHPTEVGEQSVKRLPLDGSQHVVVVQGRKSPVARSPAPWRSCQRPGIPLVADIRTRASVTVSPL